MNNRLALVLDDNDDLRFVMAHTLEILGFEVLAFRTTAEALEYVRSNRTVLELAVVDLDLNGESGDDAILRLQEDPERWPSTTTYILWSGDPRAEDAAARIQATYICKGSSRDATRAQIVAALADRLHQVCVARSLPQ